ncbi:MAG: twin-arginine translocation signal domain-containing protein [Proteobacteria bacterium]|nr:twin-arginine translocation signal domain-containing protein [Pseudomonadota bacterium]
MMNISRRNFLKGAAAAGVGSIIPMSMVTVEAEAGASFTFAWVTDQHLQLISGPGAKFVKSWDDGFKLAISEVMNMRPQPDFCFFGGDLAQAGLRSELDHGMDMWSKTGLKVKAIHGEHDYFLDMGKSSRAAYGMPADNYTFVHKGVQFIMLTTIRAAEDWEARHAKDVQNRMNQMMRIDNYVDGSAFRLGREGLAWLKKTVAGLDKNKHTIVCSHSPIQKIYNGWNFWTEDAEEIQAILKDLKRVTVLYNHVHQPMASQKGNISFLSNFSTAWPWPHVSTVADATMCGDGAYKGCAKGADYYPNLILPYHRADVANFRDATGWSIVNTNTGGKFDVSVNQWGDNPKRHVTWDGKLKEVGAGPATKAQTMY